MKTIDIRPPPEIPIPLPADRPPEIPILDPSSELSPSREFDFRPCPGEEGGIPFIGGLVIGASKSELKSKIQQNK